MREMHVRTVDRRRELRPLVEPRLRRSPVVLVSPVADELLQVAERNPVHPADARQLIGPPRPVKTLMQINQLTFRNLKPEGANLPNGGALHVRSINHRLARLLKLRANLVGREILPG